MTGLRECAVAGGAVLVMALAGAAVAAPDSGPSLDFDRTFDSPGEQRPLTFEATYLSGGSSHHLEVWRDGDARVRRRTDDALDTLAVRPTGSDEWSMTVLDRKRMIRTDIDRTNLLRIGHFTDWFSQMHALTRPRGGYRLVAWPTGVSGVTPIASCRWYRLTDGPRVSTLCWSASARVPLVIVGDDVVQWQVTRLATGPVPARAFVLDDRGYVRNDANADIQAD